VVAGLDPSGGAGLTADLQALGEAGAAGYPVAAALTAQGPRRARAFAPVATRLLLLQLEALAAEARGPARPRAVKTGMLGSAENARALAARLARPPFARLPLVVDPVLAATSGLRLWRGGSPRAALWPLLERATLATPNLPELARLSGLPVGSDEAAVAAARVLPCRAVLVKGGHRRGEPVDLLVESQRVTRFPGRRRPGSARGTGCRLASAVAAFLARGDSLADAVAKAKAMVERYLDSSDG
jgi:hydroxymethylpyrimidine/phosphomethylpyrimidine kinase